MEEKAHGIAGWFGKKADQGSNKLDGKDGKEKAENVADKVVSSVKGAAESTKQGLDDAGKQISGSTKGARDKLNDVSAPGCPCLRDMQSSRPCPWPGTGWCMRVHAPCL